MFYYLCVAICALRSILLPNASSSARPPARPSATALTLPQSSILDKHNSNHSMVQVAEDHFYLKYLVKKLYPQF